MKSSIKSIANHGQGPYGFKELSLRQMLRDPVVQDVMRADRVSVADVLKAYEFIRHQRPALAA